MKSLFGAVAFQCLGFLGQWLGYCKGLTFLIVFWCLLIAVLYSWNFPRWSQLVQTAIQTAALIILLLFSFNILSLDLGPFFKMIM